MIDIKYEKYIGEEGIFWDKLHNGEIAYELGWLQNLSKNGLPLSRHGIEWQNFTPIKREEILKIIKKFEENE